MKIGRRQARQLIANATRVVHRYRSLEGGRVHPVEEQEISREALLALFDQNPRWKVQLNSSGEIYVEVPNIYANEGYRVEWGQT